jgi:rhodanese-related sulfurtransferase
LIIIVVPAILGLTVNAVRSDGIPFVASEKGPTIAGIKKIELSEAKKFFDDKNAIFLDARSKGEFDLGHIKGAVNLPYGDFDDLYIDLLAIEKPERPIVVYCSGESCHSSDIVADMLKSEGHTALFVFFGGWPAWTGAGYPTSEIKPKPLYTTEH